MSLNLSRAEAAAIDLFATGLWMILVYLALVGAMAPVVSRWLAVDLLPQLTAFFPADEMGLLDILCIAVATGCFVSSLLVGSVRRLVRGQLQGLSTRHANLGASSPTAVAATHHERVLAESRPEPQMDFEVPAGQRDTDVTGSIDPGIILEDDDDGPSPIGPRREPHYLHADRDPYH